MGTSRYLSLDVQQELLHTLGVEYILTDEQNVLESMQAKKKSQNNAIATNTQGNSQRQYSPNSSVVNTAPVQNKQAFVQNKQSSTYAKPALGNTQNTSTQNTPTQNISIQTQNNTAHIQREAYSKELPAIWQGFLEKIQGNPSVVWTYQELYNDLTGKKDETRGSFIRLLLQGMQWKKGTSCFLPMGEYRDDKFIARPDMFWRIIQKMQVRHIICLGIDTFSSLVPAEDKKIGRVLVHGRVIYALPNWKEFMGYTEEDRKKLLTDLRLLR